MKRTILTIGLVAVLALAAQADTQYYRDLEMKDVACWEDVLHAGYILHTGKNEQKTFEEYRAYAIEHELISESWEIAADAPISKGKLAYVVVAALDIKGGIWLNLLGNNTRYAYRECLHQGLMGKASQHRYIGGKELLSVLRRGMEYRRANNPE
ncbi:MAG: hypothetical protein AAB434_06010 [Planctomycetota bacterium]